MKEKRETRVGDKERERERKIGRETGVPEIERKTCVGERDRRSLRERKIKRKIGVGGRETGMGERTIE